MGETLKEDGLFSYQAPKGWTIKETLVSKYKIALAPSHNGFTANINVVVQPYPGSLADYVTANKQALTTTPVFTHFQIRDEKPFTTSAGANGVRLVANDGLGKQDMRQIFYFFAGSSNQKFVVTASALAADADLYASVFDASLKTFSVQ